MRQQLDQIFRRQLECTLEDQLRNQLWEQLHYQLDDQLWEQLHYQLDQSHDRLWPLWQIHDQLREQL